MVRISEKLERRILTNNTLFSSIQDCFILRQTVYPVWLALPTEQVQTQRKIVGSAERVPGRPLSQESVPCGFRPLTQDRISQNHLRVCGSRNIFEKQTKLNL